MKYKKTILNQLALIMLGGSILFFVVLYLLSGSGPWDVFVYLSTLFLIALLIVLDFVVQLARDVFNG